MFNYDLLKIYIHFQGIPIHYGVQCLPMNSLKYLSIFKIFLLIMVFNV